MANKNLKSIKFPDLPDTYLIPQGTVTEADLEDLKENGTVANARQLIPSAMETESVPYNFRTSGGSLDIGDREFDKLVGLSLPWNQLVQNGNFTSTSNWSPSKCTTSASSNVLTITRNATGAMQCYQYIPTISGHKYFIASDIKSDESITAILRFQSYHTEKALTANTWTRVESIRPTSASSTEFNYYVNSGVLTQGSSIYARNAICIDLTQMFGNTIADYIASLETATAGAGVAWFKKFFGKSYYAYQAGKIESVKASSHDMVGFNQWDEQWENGSFDDNGQPITGTGIRAKNYIPIFPNKQYRFTNLGASVYAFVVYYDSDKNIVGTVKNTIANGSNFTTPSNASYMKFAMAGAYGTTYGNNICIFIHWDDSRNGEYEPYVKHSYALDPIELRGILKLDSNNDPYADGDTYEADGTVTRKYGVVDLGTLNWVYNSTTLLFRTGLTDGIKAENAEIHCVCQKYRAVVGYNPTGGINDTTQDKVISVGSSYESTNNNLLIRDTSYTDAITFKTAMSGVYLVYELATPTTETADPFTDPQTVDNWGTEQYVDKAYTDGDRDVEIPCGHETRYPSNLRDKLETLANPPASDGDYIVQSSSGQLAHVALGSTQTIQGIIARLEALENA